MLASSTSALGIIFPNSYDALVPELSNVRLMASIPFASRYRMIDFILSSMVNCGISNVTVLVRNNYFSLMDHLGSGREWDLTRKNGGLHIIPPFAEKQNKLFNGHVEALANVLEFLRHQNEKYVFLSDANIAVNFDFNAMLQAHIANNADVTAAYIAEELPASALKHTANDRGLYYTFALTGTRISKIYINPRDTGVQNFSMNIYCIERKKLIDLIKDVPYEKRTGRFVSVITMVFPDGESLVARGEVEGHLVLEKKGNHGFGYDPLFVPLGYENTFGELDSELKNRISHRARALQKLREELQNREENR